MKHKIGFNRLDRPSAHRKALHRSMVTSLFKYERITTTKAKALEIRRTAEKIITRAKIDSVHNRRLVSRRLYDEGMVAKVFSDIGLRMKDRPGGYTRIIKLGARAHDAAELVILELVDFKLDTSVKADDKKAAKAEPKAKAEGKAEAKKPAEKKPAAKKAPAKKATAKAEADKPAETKKKAPAKAAKAADK
jgi:large subunit ribosomal protein L17